MITDPSLRLVRLHKPGATGLHQFGFGVPLTPWEKRDKALYPLREHKKKITEDDANKAESGYVKSAAGGAIAGALLHGKKGAGIGAGAGILAQAVARHVSEKTKDFYGERSRRGKQLDSAPALAGEVAVAAIGAKKIRDTVKKFKPGGFRLSASVSEIRFGAGSALDEIAEKLAAQGKKLIPGVAAAPGAALSPLKNTAGRALIGAGALGGAGALAGAVAPDKGDSAASSAVSHGVKDGIFGAGLYAGTEPLLKKLFPAVHLERGADGEVEIRFAEERKGGLGKKIAGAALLAAGATALPAAASFAKPLLRGVAANKANPGRAVADYIVGSQRALNSGVHGEAIGKLLGHAKANPGGFAEKALGGPGYVDHLTRFRSSHQDALQHMTHEYIWRKGPKLGADKLPVLDGAGNHQPAVAGHAKLWKQHDAVIEDIKKVKVSHGFNEADALHHVAAKAEHKAYFGALAGYKAPAFKEYTLKTGVPAAAGLAGGGALVASGSGGEDPRKRKFNFSAHLGDTMLKTLPAATRANVSRFVSGGAKSSMPEYGMTVPELLLKADGHNLKTARKHAGKMTPEAAARDVRAKQDKKHILVLNDKIVDGHHHLAKAERGGISNSLRVLDLTPMRFSVRGGVIEFGGYAQLVGANGRKVNPLDVLSGEEKGHYIGENGRVDTAHAVQVSVANGQVLRAGYNKARGVAKIAGRVGRLGRDAADSLSGKTRTDERGRPVKKEWQKAYFKTAVATAAIGAGILGHKVAMNKLPKYRGAVKGAGDGVKGWANRMMPNTFPEAHRPGSSQMHLPGMAAAPHLSVVPKTKAPLPGPTRTKAAPTAAPAATTPTAPAAAPATAPAAVEAEKKKRGRKAVAATPVSQKTFGTPDDWREVRFEYHDPNGWDVRDGRGHSARVFAPGARPRVRREKRTLEKVGVQRKVLGGLAIAGTAAGLLAGHALGKRAATKAAAAVGSSVEERAADAFRKSRIIPFAG